MKAHLYLSPLQNVHCNSVVSSLHIFCVRFVTQKAHSFGVDVVQLYVLVIRGGKKKCFPWYRQGFHQAEDAHISLTRREKMLD